MPENHFKLDISTIQKADVYLCHSEKAGISWPLIQEFDQAAIRVIGDAPDLDPDDDRAARIMSSCSGVMAALPSQPADGTTIAPVLLRQLRLGAASGLPLLILQPSGGMRFTTDKGVGAVSLQFDGAAPFTVESRRLYVAAGSGEADAEPQRFRTDVLNLKDRDRIQPYAFLIGRLERDFTHARHAIRAAVETEAGIPCLWSDDGHRTNIESVRERTRLLIKHAAFVIADLTLGSESPERENPSRAHEIGMTIAYDRKLMLCSQEPRRYPYFSIGDMQMAFWSTEAELETKVREWIHTNREFIGRTVFNHRLPEVDAHYTPRVRKPSFQYDPKLRYAGPKTMSGSLRHFLGALVGSKLLS